MEREVQRQREIVDVRIKREVEFPENPEERFEAVFFSDWQFRGQVFDFALFVQKRHGRRNHP